MATDSLEKSVFYRSLVTEHMGLFQEAGNNCWFICIPHNSSVRDVSRFDIPFMKAHILKPSPLLRNHYIPTNNTFVEDIELKSDILLVRERTGTPTPSSSSANTVSVKILGSEDAYNDKNKLYRIIQIDRALTAKHLHQSTVDSSPKVQDVISVKDCRNYLDSISESVRKEVESKVAKLKETLFSSNRKIDLNEVQSALNTIFEWSQSRFLSTTPANSALLAAQEDSSILDYSIESLLIFPFHDQLLRTIEEMNENESSHLKSKASMMKKKKLDMSSLGTEPDLDTFYPSLEAIDLLNCLPLEDNRTPMEKMFVFKSVQNLIREDLVSCLEAAHDPFTCKPMKTLVPDDLVAATIYTIMQSEIADMVMNNLSFIQTLGTKLPVMNEMAYSLVTFEVALAFIKNYNDEDDTHFQSGQVHSQNQKLSSHTSPEHKDRSGSFSCFRNKDSRFDKQLEQLSRMVEDLSTTTDNIDSELTEGQESDTDEKRRKEEQDFLRSLHKKSLFGMSYGRLN
jgi:hypothetical protein